MRKLNQSQLESFINQNIMLSGTRERPGLMLTTANEMVKPFYRRKFISSRTFLPQAKRFAANSWKLLEKKIPAPVVKEVIYCPDYPVHMVVYNRIDGRDLRELCAEQGNDLISLVPAYLAELHRLGIFFRAIHLGNLIYDGYLGPPGTESSLNPFPTSQKPGSSLQFPFGQIQFPGIRHSPIYLRVRSNTEFQFTATSDIQKASLLVFIR